MSGFGASAWGEDIPKKIDEDMALRLAAESNHGGLKYLDSYDYEGPSTWTPPFYEFDGLGPVTGSFGFFAVNPWTGDVWSLWDCKKLGTPASRRDLAKIRERFTAEELKQYAKLSRLHPKCM